MVARLGRRLYIVTNSGYWVSFWGNENVLELVGMVAH